MYMKLHMFSKQTPTKQKMTCNYYINLKTFWKHLISINATSMQFQGKSTKSPHQHYSFCQLQGNSCGSPEMSSLAAAWQLLFMGFQGKDSFRKVIFMTVLLPLCLLLRLPLKDCSGKGWDAPQALQDTLW